MGVEVRRPSQCGVAPEHSFLKMGDGKRLLATVWACVVDDGSGGATSVADLGVGDDLLLAFGRGVGEAPVEFLGRHVSTGSLT